MCAPAWEAERRRFRFGEANFEGVTFVGPVSFAGAEFGTARFRGASFNGPVSFDAAEFRGEARFDSATFAGSASFKDARFRGEAVFEHPDDEGLTDGWPEEVTFRRWVDFRFAKFTGVARFGGAHFERRARFGAAEFKSDATFVGATFNEARTVGPIKVAGVLKLDRVAFQAPVRIRVDEARVISCYGTHFQSLTTIDVGRGEIRLSEAEFAHPSIVSGRIYEGKPRVASLHRANVANLTLADVDLRGCSFVDVHNLDGLRFEGASEFPTMGGRWRTHRRVIADELDLRESGARDEVVVARIARAYRALRKGREDSKDAPGAADFYYGEMEMRRISSNPFERAIITLYWLLSGYGLRASRALAALAVAVLAFAFAFDAWGFYPDGPFGKSAIFSAESTSSLFRTPDPPGGSHLTDAGHVLQMGLRLVGPLFLGLALLALRGRVKR